MASERSERGHSRLQYSLRERLDVEAIGNDEYRAKNLWMSQNMRAVYGGQVMGHALMAAVKRVSNINHSFLLNSFHCHFVRPMQTTPDVTYKVNHVKFGSNFCSLSVKAVQSDKVCFLCLVCFQKPHKLEEADLCYSIYSMPTVALPQEPIIASELPENGITTLVQVQLDGFPFHVYSCMDREEYQKKLSFQPTKPKFSTWMKGIGTFGKLDHQNNHRIALAYASDFRLATMFLSAFPKFNCGLIASLDHSMWFHQHVDAERWYLFDGGTEHAVNGMSLNSSRVFNEDGVVVASCNQQALFRSKL